VGGFLPIYGINGSFLCLILLLLQLLGFQADCKLLLLRHTTLFFEQLLLLTLLFFLLLALLAFLLGLLKCGSFKLLLLLHLLLDLVILGFSLFKSTLLLLGQLALLVGCRRCCDYACGAD